MTVPCIPAPPRVKSERALIALFSYPGIDVHGMQAEELGPGRGRGRGSWGRRVVADPAGRQVVGAVGAIPSRHPGVERLQGQAIERFQEQLHVRAVVPVIHEHTRGGDVQRRIDRSEVGVGVGLRSNVDGVDRDRDRGQVAVESTIESPCK